MILQFEFETTFVSINYRLPHMCFTTVIACSLHRPVYPTCTMYKVHNRIILQGRHGTREVRTVRASHRPL